MNITTYGPYNQYSSSKIIPDFPLGLAQCQTLPRKHAIKPAHGLWQMNKSNKEVAVWSMHEMLILPFPCSSSVVIAMSYQL